MVKKTMNSLFLNYLLQSQDNIEANVEKWTKDFNIAENIDEISETLNELSKRAYPAICERSYDLRADSIIECLGLKDFDYNRVSSYGHIGKSDYLRRSKESI